VLWCTSHLDSGREGLVEELHCGVLEVVVRGNDTVVESSEVHVVLEMRRDAGGESGGRKTTGMSLLVERARQG